MKNVKIYGTRYVSATNAITLIALIITIIILLILAGVTINVLIGDNGLFNIAKEAGEEQNKAIAYEKVNAMLAEYMTKRYTENKPLIDFLNEKKKSKEIQNIIDNNNETYTIEVDGYNFTIKESDLSIIEISKTGQVYKWAEYKANKNWSYILVDNVFSVEVHDLNQGVFGYECLCGLSPKEMFNGRYFECSNRKSIGVYDLDAEVGKTYVNSPRGYIDKIRVLTVKEKTGNQFVGKDIYRIQGIEYTIEAKENYEKLEFIQYVTSNDPEAYPDKDGKGNNWYEKISN